MAVGAVPVLQYPKYYEPALVNQKNCVAFSDQISLVNSLKDILDGRYDSDVAIMSRQARQYYQDYLSSEAFCGQFIQFLGGSRQETELRVCNNALSVALFKQSLAKQA